MITALVVGGGSIGKRHLRNLLATGRTAAVVEPREDRRAEIAAKHPGVPLHASLDAALAAERYQAGFICLPTAYHLDARDGAGPAGHAPLHGEAGLAHARAASRSCSTLVEQQELIA